MIPVYRPHLPPRALERAHGALDSTWVSSIGPYIEEAEDRLRNLFGVRHVVLTNTGTAAIHLVACALLRRRQDIERIICPNNVFAAAWNAFLCDEWRAQLILVDADMETWNTDENLLRDAIGRAWQETGGRVAVLAVHNLGNVVHVPRLRAWALERGMDIPVVEDNCEGLLGSYGAQWTGAAALASAASFYGNKSLTAGEGGAFLTDDADLAAHARLIARQGQSSTRFVHSVLGHNYRMTNVAAAVLLGQLDCIDEIRSRKERIFARYADAIDASRGRLVAQAPARGTTPAQWLFGVRIPGLPGYPVAERHFAERCIEVRPMFYPASAHAYMRSHPRVRLGEEGVASLLQRECVVLPSYPDMTEAEQGCVIDALISLIRLVNGVAA